MPVEEVDFASAEVQAKFNNRYGEGRRGLYQPSDLSNLELSGNSNDTQLIELHFIPCEKDERTNCLEESAIQNFVESHSFNLFKLSNFIDMSEVKPADQTLNNMVE